MKGSNSHPQKRQRTGNERRSAKLLDLDVLDCPVCFEPLTIPTFQCDDGHLVCRFCFAKAINKCPRPACNLPTGNKQCFSIERVLNSVFVPCRNAEFGCSRSLSYGQVSSHEKECNFSLCSCHNLACKYTGSENSIYHHFVRSHKDYFKIVSPFTLRYNNIDAQVYINGKNFVLRSRSEKRLFVVKCFRKRLGVNVTVRSISPSAPEVRKKLSYRLSYSVDGHVLTYESPEVKTFLKVSSQSPEESFMFVPNSLLRGQVLKIKLGIKKLNRV